MEETRQEQTYDDTQPVAPMGAVDRVPQNQPTAHIPTLVITLVTTALLLPGLGYLYTRLSQGHMATVPTQSFETAPTQPPVTPEKIQRAILHIDRYNLLANLPEGWHETQVPNDMPPHVVNPLVAATHPDAQCTAVYATLATKPFHELYVSTGEEDIVRNKTHIARIEYRIATTTNLFAEQEPARATSSPTIAYTYQPLYYDNGSHDVTRNAWVIYSNNGSSLSELCKDGFRTLTNSLVRHFEEQPLTRNDSGLLYMETHQGAGTFLLFRNSVDNIARVVTTLDVGAIFKPTLRDGTLTFIGTRGDIRSYALFSETPAFTHPIVLTDDESVSDFRSIEHTLFYLVGPWCRSESTPCALTLMEYNHTTSNSNVIATNIDRPNIDALSLEESTVASSTAELLNAKPTAIVHALTLQNGALTTGPSLFEGSVAERIPFIVYE